MFLKMVLFFLRSVIWIGPPIEASSIDRTQRSRFHLMTRERPSLEMLWLQNTRTMDKIEIIDRSSRIKAFGLLFGCIVF
jgi:hypothetical protein